jgi:hypothetical protein
MNAQGIVTALLPILSLILLGLALKQIRFNTYIALALAQAFFCNQGLTMGARPRSTHRFQQLH